MMTTFIRDARRLRKGLLAFLCAGLVALSGGVTGCVSPTQGFPPEEEPDDPGDEGDEPDFAPGLYIVP